MTLTYLPRGLVYENEMSKHLFMLVTQTQT